MPAGLAAALYANATHRSVTVAAASRWWYSSVVTEPVRRKPACSMARPGRMMRSVNAPVAAHGAAAAAAAANVAGATTIACTVRVR